LIFWLNEKQNQHLLPGSELKSRIIQFKCGFLLYFWQERAYIFEVGNTLILNGI